MYEHVLADLYNTVLQRRENPTEGSYTCYLFDKGLDKILKKCGEECSETIIAAKNGDSKETVYVPYYGFDGTAGYPAFRRFAGIGKTQRKNRELKNISSGG